MTQTEALKLALEALTIQSDRVTEIGKKREAITAIKEALAQPEQKPSYWLGYGLQAQTEKPFEGATPLFTHPPVPTAQTEKDISKIGCVNHDCDKCKAQPEQEQIAVWLEKECDEQYLADRVRAGDYAKEKGHTENCAALADDIGKRHLSPSLVGVGDKDYTAQPELAHQAYKENT